ncbi:MAG: antibiotic biosynthesis monooxygenase family protein [Gemmatimonadota bacterium]
MGPDAGRDRPPVSRGARGRRPDRLRRRGTELYRDRGEPDRFVTVDRWDSEEAYRGFRDGISSEFDALDRACEAFTVLERPLGVFETVGARAGGQSPPTEAGHAP